jgi:hypothetical protein
MPMPIYFAIGPADGYEIPSMEDRLKNFSGTTGFSDFRY